MSVRFGASGRFLRRTAALPTDSAFTMAGWARLTALRTAWSFLGALEDNTVNATKFYLVGWTNADVFEWTSHSDVKPFTRQPAAGEWFYWAFTSSGLLTGQANGYVSRATDTDFETQQGTNATPTFTTANLQFGNDSFDEWFNGDLAHVRVWDAALTSAELLSEKNSATVVRTANLHLVYRLATSTDTADISGNGKDPTIGGTLSTSDDPPVGSGLPTRYSLQLIFG